MDETVVLIKIDSLKRCLDRIVSKYPVSKDELRTNLDLQDIVTINLERAVQVCVDIAAHVVADLDARVPQTMAESFERLSEAGVISRFTAERLQKAVGFRNIAVHEYQSINWEVVHIIITNHLDDFRLYAKEVLQWIKGSQQPTTIGYEL